MPFVRFARDKRGYEYVYLVHAATRKGKSAKPRVLYWYRTPPGVKVGREPFDSDIRRELEKRHPGLTFDWDAIVSTPMPPPEIDWRERRRVQRAAKEARAALEQEELAEEVSLETPIVDEGAPTAEETVVTPVESGVTRLESHPIDEAESADSAKVPESADPERRVSDIDVASVPTVSSAGDQLAEGPRPQRRRRRRRRSPRQTGASREGSGGESGPQTSAPADTARPADSASETRPPTDDSGPPDVA